MSSTSEAPAPIVVLGAGIIGLTTAVRILESQQVKQGQKHPVHIIADHLPGDPYDAYYSSTIAGAHHLSFADDNDARQRRWDSLTFRTMYNEWKAIGEQSGLMAVRQTELYVGTRKHLAIYEEHPEFSIIDPKTITQCPVDHAISFMSLTMTPATYLNRLLARIQTLSGGIAHIHRYRLPSLSEISGPQVKALIGGIPPAAIIVCVGIGAVTLGGVRDETVFPTRGQVVKIRAPWVRSGWTRQVGDLDGGEGGERTYVIPRPDGDVILGGTREVDDWHPYPREDTKADILRRALEICPHLQPAHVAAPDLLGTIVEAQTGVTLDHLVVDHLVGFRPSRKDGVRLERGEDVGSTVVIHNYGHGGAGWQSCWGSAEDAVAMLLSALGS